MWFPRISLVAIRKKDEQSPIAHHFVEAGHPVAALSFIVIEHIKCTSRGDTAQITTKRMFLDFSFKAFISTGHE